jgi:hypothetical protein
MGRDERKKGLHLSATAVLGVSAKGANRMLCALGIVAARKKM